MPIDPPLDEVLTEGETGHLEAHEIIHAYLNAGGTLETLLAAKQALSAKGQANGYASLGLDTKVPLAQRSGGLLAAKASTTAPSTTSTTFVDADSTNLTITFTVPSSGKVLVRFTSMPIVTNDYAYYWAVREGSTDVGGESLVKSDGKNHPHSTAWLIEGLTPGASKTYKWSHRVNNAAATGEMYPRPKHVMEVWEVPS